MFQPARFHASSLQAALVIMREQQRAQKAQLWYALIFQPFHIIEEKIVIKMDSGFISFEANEFNEWKNTFWNDKGKK